MIVPILISLSFASLLHAECPPTIQPPCSCSSTRYEAVSIVCDKADSLNSVLIALAHPPPEIDSLVISNTPIDQIPAFAFQGFNIKKLVFRNNGLRYLHADAFGGTLETFLEELDIRGNYLNNIPQQGITSLKNLKTLLLSDNMIEVVGENAFLSYHSRESLERLDLSANNMTTIEPTGLLGLESLTQLSLDKNSFTEIPTQALSNVPTLEDLSMSVNQIQNVAPHSLPLPNLKSLSLEVNQIRNMLADSLQSTPSLTYLYLGNNLLTSIDSSMFFYTNNIKVLSMGNNKDITTIHSNSFQHISNLVRLELSDCSITSIEPNALHKIKKLQVILLARNQITHVQHDSFATLPELISIDLSGNSINNIDDFAFSQLPNLKTLDISGNRLETLPANLIYDTFVTKTGAQPRTFYLHNNPWRCDEEMNWLRKWLRANGDVVISALGAHSARCWSPVNLNGLDLRQTNPVPRPTEQPVAEQMRKLIKPATNFFVSPKQTTTNVKEEEHVQAKIEGISLVALVLGVVLGMLAICLILLVVIRCIIRNLEKKDARSSTNSVSSAFGSSAYSGTGMLGGAQRSTTNHNVYLNRPRYWWF